MIKYKKYTTKQDSVMRIKIHEAGVNSTIDQINTRGSKSKEKSKRVSARLNIENKSKTIIKDTKIKNQQKKLPAQDGNSQLQLIFKLSNQILESNFQTSKSSTQRTQKNTLFHNFHKLFELYIKEEILKHYCLKSQWRFEKKVLDKIVLPTFDLLSISKNKIWSMFEPFLKQLTSRYILHTQLDTYSRLSSQHLLIQITEIWLRIKQAEIELKRTIRQNYSQFKLNYCKVVNNLIAIDKNKLFTDLFFNSKDIRMVNLIKVFIFSFKAEGQGNECRFQDWLQSY